MISGAGVTPELLALFYDACARYTRLEPWNRLAERQAIQIDARDDVRIDKRHSVSRGTVFSSVIATRAADANIHGLALFFTRADLERRVLPPGETLAHLAHPELRRCGFCDKKAAPGSELRRCTRCKCTFYCNSECQKSHWRDHKLNCIAPGAAPAASTSSIQWGAKEISILFGAVTSVPFDDLDAIDKHGFAIATYDNAPYYPSAVVFKHGEPEVPDVSSLFWLTRALEAQIALLEHHPQFMQSTLADFVGLDDDAHAEPRKVDVAATTLGFADHLVVRNSTVLTSADVAKIRGVVAKQQAAASDASATESAAAKDSGDSSASGDDKACAIM